MRGGLLLLLLLLLLPLAAGLAAVEEPWVIDSDGVDHHAEMPEILTRPIRFQQTGASGLQATFIARSLRSTRQDDWRQSQAVAGTRHDAQIHQPRSAFGGEEERVRFGLDGRAGDWDNFSVQWDGCILVPAGGIDLATKSDDGSRVWLDLDRDGVTKAEEWGSNGWGSGQGAILRQVHAGVAAGNWLIRVQFEEGGGGNSCSLMWRPAGGAAAWTPVPPVAFDRTPVLTLSGPLTFRAPISGVGELHLGDGVVLATAPAVGLVAIGGRVRLAADVVADGLRLHVPHDAVLDLAGHRLACAGIRGDGSVQLGGGSLALGEAGALAIRGRGRLEVAGELVLAGLDASVDVVLIGPASLRSAERSLVRRSLAAPLVTILELGAVPTEAGTLNVALDGPLAGAGLMAWRADRHGRWFQRLAAPVLHDGLNRIAVDLSASARLQPVGHAAAWNSLTAGESSRAGLLIYADRPIAGTVLADAAWGPTAAATAPPTLTMLALPPAQARTGERIEVRVRPQPFPAWPLDPDCFSVELAVTAPDGGITHYAGFADQPFVRVDRGNREQLLADGPPRFGLRFRARMPGTHLLHLSAHWADGTTAETDLPPLIASGAAWDDIARPDAGDPRFLSAQDRFVWPIGQNLNSTYDVRSRAALGTRLTPDRGSFTREAFLARLIAAGGTGCETWLSPWNLGLEWTDAWAGYHGAGRPNLSNAWALDRYLDQAERGGVRVILSIFNHGQGRDGSGAEDDWPYHPWRAANGGWLAGPPGLFTDKRALQAQSNLFRYLAARWGDSPALLTWKLWAEVNLVHAPIGDVRAWHERAAALFARHDPWRHPVTTHWCGDWNNADPEIAAQSGLGMLTIDAYHGEDGGIAELLGNSTRSAGRSAGGLAGYGKPVLVTEYGGSPMATSPPRLEAELAIGGWAALVHGHAGAPMLWWFEWIDQGARYGQFGALLRFTAGEDLRDPAARTVAPRVEGGGGRMWCRVWQRPGRMLGYVLDQSWAARGEDTGTVPDGTLDFGTVAAGALHLAWWDADLGAERIALDLDHAGGALLVPVPPFLRHLAFKLWRRDGGTTPARASR